ncbi:hypothetical protein DM813_08275, partial [Pseudomonas alkylphenolica]
MYLIEWMLWYTQTSKSESEDWQQRLEKHVANAHAGKYKHEDNLPGIHDRVSEAPCADGSIYEFNETYIEIKSGAMGERRGVMTYVTLMIIYFLYSFAGITLILNSVWFTGVQYWMKTPATVSHYITGLFVASMTAGCFYVVFRYARIFIRLENFVQRRLLIRFNRVTRQVYLHRPRFAGGIAVLDWEQVIAQSVVGEEESAN